ncbi:MAG: hypothetical protein ACI4BD_04830 [Paludibacteraceae bacterium]
MKKILFGTVCVCMAVLFAGCDEAAEVRSTKGTYSFKTSGTATLTTDEESRQVALNDESGQMEVVSLHQEDSVLLTFNQVDGGVYSTRGVIAPPDKDGQATQLRFAPFERTYSVITTKTVYDTIHTVIGGFVTTDSVYSRQVVVSDAVRLTVSGTATIYDKSILFSLHYQGQGIEDETILLEAENVQMIAKKN